MIIPNARRKARGGSIKAHGRLFRVAIVSCVLVLYFLAPEVAFSAWSGVDESVVEKIAGEHGRKAREPLINTDKGDLLLFVFLLAGAVGGFTAGYYWRVLMEGKAKKHDG